MSHRPFILDPKDANTPAVEAATPCCDPAIHPQTGECCAPNPSPDEGPKRTSAATCCAPKVRDEAGCCQAGAR